MDDMGHLSPQKYRQGDFFVADLFDISAKNDIASMEHPVFALKAGDTKLREYKHNDVVLQVKPGHGGLATIHDKDIWIYCISQLAEAMNRGREDVDRTVRFIAYDFLKTTNRRTDGDSYKRLGDALSRLAGTQLEINKHTNGKRSRGGFGLIDSWEIVEKDKSDRMVSIEVTLPDWLYRAVQGKEVLTINKDYFRLRKPLDRRVYELARKHCGRQTSWKVSLSLLHKKTGSGSELKKLRMAMKGLAESNELPDYRMKLDLEKDQLTFYSRKPKGQVAEMMATLAI